MRCVLYVNRSESNKLFKDITQVAEIDITFKEQTNIIDPVLTLKTNVDYSNNCNYLYIPEYDRFYFIMDFTSVKKGLWQVNCHVDVLTSNRVEINKLRAVISRQEFVYNLNLDDGTLKATADPIVITKSFPKSIRDYEGSEVGSNILIIGGGTKLGG